MEKLTVRSHAEYQIYYPFYQAIADFVDGTLHRVQRYLVPYRSEITGSVEATAAFNDRKSRTYNENHCKPWLLVHLGHLSQPISISGFDSDTADVIKADVTGFGKNYLQHLRDQMWTYLTYGRVGILIDSDPVVAPGREEAQQRLERSYQVLYEPRDIRYWSYFERGPRRGQLKEIVVLCGSRYDEDGQSLECAKRFFFDDKAELDRNSPFLWQSLVESQEEKKSSKKRIDKVSAQAVAASGRLVPQPALELDYVVEEEGTGSLAEIPFVMTGDGYQESFLKDIWQLNIKDFNLGSVLSNINYHQGFQRVIVSGKNLAKEDLKTWAENIIIALSLDSVGVFTIDPGNPDSIMQEREGNRLRIQRLGLMQHTMLNEGSRESPSAESKAKDLLARKKYYDYLCDLFEDALARIYRFHSLYEGNADPSISVNIGRDFGLDDPGETTNKRGLIFAQASQLGVTEVQKAVLKLAISEMEFIPLEGETKEEAKRHLLDAVDAAESGGSTNEFNPFAALSSRATSSAEDEEPAASQPQQETPISEAIKTIT